jgi:hypothetical protein
MSESMNVSPRTFPLSADRLGIWASALCVVHCIVAPVLLSLSIVFARLLPREEPTHRFMASAVAALGAAALIKGFRTHGRRRILVLMAMGLACIFVGAFWSDLLPSHRLEVLVTLTGSVLMIVAHRMNHTFCQDCNRCTH